MIHCTLTDLPLTYILFYSIALPPYPSHQSQEPSHNSQDSDSNENSSWKTSNRHVRMSRPVREAPSAHLAERLETSDTRKEVRRSHDTAKVRLSPPKNSSDASDNSSRSLPDRRGTHTIRSWADWDSVRSAQYLANHSRSRTRLDRSRRSRRRNRPYRTSFFDPPKPQASNETTQCQNCPANKTLPIQSPPTDPPPI